MTRIPLNTETQKFHAEVHRLKARYPYWCETHTSSPRPELVHVKTYGHFVRVPIIYADLDVAVWGFETIEGRAKFMATYGAEEWTP